MFHQVITLIKAEESECVGFVMHMMQKKDGGDVGAVSLCMSTWNEQDVSCTVHKLSDSPLVHYSFKRLFYDSISSDSIRTP